MTKKKAARPPRKRQGVDQMVALIADLEAKIQRKARKSASAAQKPTASTRARRSL